MSLVKPNLPRSQRIPKWWLGTVAALGFVGFLDAVYLTAKHYTGFEITCSLVHGCEQVLTSQFATVFGIPVALFGVVYYLGIVVCVVAFVDRKNLVFLIIAVLLPQIGFLFTLWLLATQFFFIGAWCLYCLVSAAITTMLFFLAVYYMAYSYIRNNS